MSIDINDFKELASQGVPTTGGPSIFHAVYITGQLREGEEIGKIQIKDVAANLDSLDMVILNVKAVKANMKMINGKEVCVCFSYMDSEPYKGTGGRLCVQPSQRDSHPFCNSCRAQIIVVGLYVNSDGTPILSEDGEPQYIFIRGKGTKYSPISNYLYEVSTEDYDPIFTPVTTESKLFEKKCVNYLRHITHVSKGTVETSHGIKTVFELSKGKEIPLDLVKKLLKKSKDLLPLVKMKFDITNRIGGGNIGYVPQVDTQNQFSSSNESQQEKSSNPKSSDVTQQSPADVDMIDFF